MIKITEDIWIGNAVDEYNADLTEHGIHGILNVAIDLQCSRGYYSGIEYGQVGLIDGPGNPISAYHAAVLALASMLKRGKVLICCHEAARSLAVAVMYLRARYSRGWDACIEIIGERCDNELPVPHPVHKEVQKDINWRMLSSLIGD